MKRINIRELAGEFCENKDIAKRIREEVVLPALEGGDGVLFDFDGVSGATQSFIHALVSDAIRKFGDRAFDSIFYKNANSEVQKIIEIVYDYMQLE